MTNYQLIVFDWAGTTIDFGCMAPVRAFEDAFLAFDMHPTMEEIRAPMGLAKRAHIEKMLQSPRLKDAWENTHGRNYQNEDINALYKIFEEALLKNVKDYATPKPHVLAAINRFKSSGIAIGSTTGYTRKMMEIVAPQAKVEGYEPDCLITPDEVDNIG